MYDSCFSFAYVKIASLCRILLIYGFNCWLHIYICWMGFSSFVIIVVNLLSFLDLFVGCLEVLGVLVWVVVTVWNWFLEMNGGNDVLPRIFGWLKLIYPCLYRSMKKQLTRSWRSSRNIMKSGNQFTSEGARSSNPFLTSGSLLWVIKLHIISFLDIAFVI